MAGHQREKVVPDEVHQNQILRELYLRELRTQKLYTQYHVNPLRKVHTITRKPMSWHDNLEEPADGLVPAWLLERPSFPIPSRGAGTQFVLNKSCLKMSEGTRHPCLEV
ncbi:cilia- and flagella-associated protein 144 isoform X3 [Tamandua tetradactyla]|uniref:cilia- and flagella-associated protein 144 isoform X3 n=1 Tax=Tamandua tetradactyla TaxID=48850 RepID=UPI004053DD3B